MEEEEGEIINLNPMMTGTEIRRFLKTNECNETQGLCIE